MTKKHKERLKELGVSIVYLFGSRATGRRTRSSDIDIGVVFRELEFGGDHRAVYHALYQLFSEAYPDSKLDIVLLQASPVSLQYSAIKEGKILFEIDPVFTTNYENQTVNRYLDFRPVMDFFDQVATEHYGKAKRSITSSRKN
jgi:predicted nucleotidyltransferase